MRRLSVQLALAMLGTMVLTLVVIAGTQRWAEWRRFYDLPEEVRLRVPHPRPLLPDGVTELFAPQAPRGPRPDGGDYGTGLPGGAPDAGSYNEQLASSYRAFNRFQNEALLLGVALAAGMSLALALWLSRLVARPIERVSAATTLLAQGDLTTRVPPSAPRGLTSLETERLTENFNSMAQSLENYEGERKAMIADIAHELRTPLTALSLRLQALQDGLVPLTAAEVTSLNRNAELLARLVEDLRVLSLADAGRLELRRRNVDLTALAAAVLDDYQTRLTSQQVAGELQAPQQRVLAFVDPDRLTQVLGNLIDNALRVTGEGGRVTVT
ncbi:MAG: histidine kinase dimerization/phospho-acceptor domain-containing protein, partial [Trueperaceae bacterium]